MRHPRKPKRRSPRIPGGGLVTTATRVRKARRTPRGEHADADRAGRFVVPPPAHLLHVSHGLECAPDDSACQVHVYDDQAAEELRKRAAVQDARYLARVDDLCRRHFRLLPGAYPWTRHHVEHEQDCCASETARPIKTSTHLLRLHSAQIRLVACSRATTVQQQPTHLPFRRSLERRRHVGSPSGEIGCSRFEGRHKREP
jgi:hypothetical protein